MSVPQEKKGQLSVIKLVGVSYSMCAAAVCVCVCLCRFRLGVSRASTLNVDMQGGGHVPLTLAVASRVVKGEAMAVNEADYTTGMVWRVGKVTKV